MQPAVFTKFLKFFTVGGLGFGVDMATTWVVKEWLGLPKFAANSVGFAIGMGVRFVANRIWTFQSTDPNWIRQALLFFGFAAIGLGIVNAIIWLLNEKLGWTNFYVAKVLAMLVFFGYNFTVNLLVTFG